MHSIQNHAFYIESYQLLMSPHYCTYDIIASIYETTSSMQGHIHTMHATSQPEIGVMTLALLKISRSLCMTSHSDNVWHLLHYTRYHILALLHQATIFMTSHALYLTSYPLYPCHHIQSIDDIIATEFLRCHPLYMMTSYTLYMTSQPLNVCHHTHPFNDITTFVCGTSHPLYV